MMRDDNNVASRLFFLPMLTNVQNILESAVKTLSLQPFQLQEIPGFPYQEYNERIEKYRTDLSWFTGAALTDPEETADTAMYPIKINPLINTCMKHAYAVLGDVPDDGRPQVVPKFMTEGNKSSVNSAIKAEGVLNRVWSESFGRSILFTNALANQIFGGSILGWKFVPKEANIRTIPFKITRINPEHFIGVLMPEDEYRLQESWIVKPITYEEAEKYGYFSRYKNEQLYWIEHWELDRVSVQINKQFIQYDFGDYVFNGIGDNMWGFIPHVYNPHIRLSGFWGMNNIDYLTGLVREQNLRFADYGDAVNQDSHTYVAYRNVQGVIKVSKIAPALDGLDLGQAAGISGNEPDPDIFEVRKQTASAAMKDILTLLGDQYRRDSSLPKVADGEDEGSQRSAQTLVARMWPLVAHTHSERYYMGPALDWFTWMGIRMMNMKKVPGIDKTVLSLRVRQEFAPTLPKDRELLIQEVTQRSAQDITPPTQLMEMLGDTEDIEERFGELKEWMEFKAELKAKEKIPMGDPNSDFGDQPKVNGTSNSSSEKKEKPNE